MNDLNSTNKLLLLVTTELLAHCSYCTSVSTDPLSQTPIYCTKFSGSCNPILVNVTTCLTCGEYKKGISPDENGKSHTRTA